MGSVGVEVSGWGWGWGLGVGGKESRLGEWRGREKRCTGLQLPVRPKRARQTRGHAAPLTADRDVLRSNEPPRVVPVASHFWKPSALLCWVQGGGGVGGMGVGFRGAGGGGDSSRAARRPPQARQHLESLTRPD